MQPQIYDVFSLVLLGPHSVTSANVHKLAVAEYKIAEESVLMIFLTVVDVLVQQLNSANVTHFHALVRHFFTLGSSICQRHGLAVPGAGWRFYVVGSIHGWNRSHLLLNFLFNVICKQLHYLSKFY